jgi:branched-chain amino acid transport system substrate-binding protein
VNLQRQARRGERNKSVRRGGRERKHMTQRGVNRRSVLIGAGAAATSLATGAGPARAADPMKVGILFPLTGNAAAAGQAAKAAVEVAADIVNSAHPELKGMPLAEGAGLPGLGGAKLDLTFIDHQGNPSVAQQQALRLIND